jgi:gluconolactonase
MDGEQIADGLDFPEGPVWDDGTLWFTEIIGGRVSRWTAAGGVERLAETGGGPNGATLDADGSLFVTQNGGMVPGADRVPGAIQRVTADGNVSTVATEVDGLRLDGPNDLAFGEDGRLYFTDPRGAADPAHNDLPGRLFALDVESGAGELILETGPSFPNGIGFTADGTLLWTESFTRRVMRLGSDGPEVVVELPERHFPDGFCVDADDRLWVASTWAHCVTVVDGGQIVDRLVCGDGMVTNCCFGGTDLYVTESRHGTLWRFVVGVAGLPMRVGGRPE